MDGASADEYNPLLERHARAKSRTPAGRGHQAPPPASGLILDLKITDDEFGQLLDQAEQDRQRAAPRAAAVSSVAFKIDVWERIARQVAENQRAA